MAPQSLSPTANTTGHDRCHFLSIPPEMRNRIYELAYPCAKQVSFRKTDLLRTGAPAPSKALLLTCRQIYAEAKLIYREVWDGTEFTVSTNEISVDGIRVLEEWRLERVSRLRITRRRRDEWWTYSPISGQQQVESEETKELCHLRKGVWTCQNLATWPNGTKLVLLPPGKAEHAERARFETETLRITTRYRAVNVTEMDEKTVVRVKTAIGRKNLRKEELVAMVREACAW